MNPLTLLHLGPIAEFLTAASVAAGELFSVAALLWCLNGLSKAIKLVFVLGLWTGWVCKRFLIPALLLTADKISELNALIDWQQVRSDVYNYLLIITAAVIAGVQVAFTWIVQTAPAAYQQLISFSEQLGKLYAALIAPQTPQAAPAGVIKPLRDAKGRFVSTKRSVRRHGRLVVA